MTYPAVRYRGDGEVTATFRPSDAPADLTYPNGVRVDYLATGATTGGDFGLYRWTFGPGESGPDPHFHRTTTESFFVLTGTVRLFNGTEWIDARSGDFLHVPPGGVHAFRNVADEPASMLLLFTPGAPREHYFEGLLALATGWHPTDEARVDFFLAHDNIGIER